VRINMANCFERLDRPVEARFNYERFLEESGAEVTPSQRKEVESTIAKLSAKIGSLLVVTQPSGANVTVNGAATHRAPSGAIELGAGSYTLRIDASGYEPVETTVDVQAGVEQRIDVALTPTPSLPVVAEVGQEPESSPALAERTPEPAVDAEPRRRPLLWAAVGTTAVFAAGFAVSGALALKAQHDFDAAVTRSNDPTRSSLERARAREDGLQAADRADLTAMISDVLLAGTVVAGGTALLIWLRGRKQAEQQLRVNAGPMMLKRGGAGLAVSGRF
jgi:hypothetical protein